MPLLRIEIDSDYNDIIFNTLSYEEAPSIDVQCYINTNKHVIFEFKANKISNLRAAFNSFIKWIDMIKNIVIQLDTLK
jgi:tRNA threonylcarbamoyladenosine modification (KEOPS) complex  Pcc1 subunit